MHRTEVGLTRHGYAACCGLSRSRLEGVAPRGLAHADHAKHDGDNAGSEADVGREIQRFAFCRDNTILWLDTPRTGRAGSWLRMLSCSLPHQSSFVFAFPSLTIGMLTCARTRQSHRLSATAIGRQVSDVPTSQDRPQITQPKTKARVETIDCNPTVVEKTHFACGVSAFPFDPGVDACALTAAINAVARVATS